MLDFKWSLLECQNPMKAWITTEAGDKITPLMGAPSAFKIVKMHNQVIDVIEAKLRVK